MESLVSLITEASVFAIKQIVLCCKENAVEGFLNHFTEKKNKMLHSAILQSAAFYSMWKKLRLNIKIKINVL